MLQSKILQHNLGLSAKPHEYPTNHRDSIAAIRLYTAGEDESEHKLDLQKGTSPVGLDLGGTLAKLVYFESADTVDATHELDLESPLESFSLDFESGQLHFLSFASNEYQENLKRLNEEEGISPDIKLCATGGGATKLKQDLVSIQEEDEIQMLRVGMNFVLSHFKAELFFYNAQDTRVPLPLEEEIKYPYLLVNIGSGVSIINVTGPGEDNFTRYFFILIGGGTFFGLSKFLTNIRTFDEALDLANDGDSTKVNLTVKDIYVYLPENLTAAYFGKNKPAHVERADLIEAALEMVSSAIGAIAGLQAYKHIVQKYRFTGSFLKNNETAMKKLTQLVDGKRALFFKNDGYFGALGSLLECEKTL
eukprot:GSMAST32.ASY1.ANO1.73.1 assembled CDS